MTPYHRKAVVDIAAVCLVLHLLDEFIQVIDQALFLAFVDAENPAEDNPRFALVFFFEIDTLGDYIQVVPLVHTRVGDIQFFLEGVDERFQLGFVDDAVIRGRFRQCWHIHLLF